MKTIEKFNNIRNTSSTIEKEKLLKEYMEDNNFIYLILYTYDKVLFTYNVGEKILEVVFTYDVDKEDTNWSSADVIKQVRWLLNLNLRGDELKTHLIKIFSSLSKNEAELFRMVLRRDLRLGVNTKILNKYLPKSFKIIKPAYCRCGIFNDKTKKNINYPAYLQVKEDGMYIEAFITDTDVKLLTRQGEIKHFQSIIDELLNINYLLNNYHLIGEVRVLNTCNNRTLLINNGLSIKRADSIKGKYLPRTLGNGLLNSDYPPKDIKYIVWDIISDDEYKNALDNIKNSISYVDRFDKLLSLINLQTINIVKTKVVYNENDVLNITRDWINEGEEGTILKYFNMIFKNGTSNQQLKIKPVFTVDVEITGFIEGKKGTKREKTFGSLTFKSVDGKLRGSTSGFTDEELEMFNKDREKWIGKIIEVEATAATKAKNKDIYALQHPRFIEVRYDKSGADTLERILENEKTFRI